ncbi:MAG: hypothetical protein V1746_08045 [bacterium]
MKSWKTTLFGALAALGVYLENLTEPSWMPMVGKVLVMISTFLVGLFARDNSVTSEQAGAK